jgi:hypothetical protein
MLSLLWSPVRRILITIAIELTPSWEDASCTAAQEFSNILWNSSVHYRVHKSPPLVPILNQINPVQTTPYYLRSILISSTYLRLGFPSALFPSVFPTKILYALLISPICAKCSAHLILLYLIILIIRVQVMKESIFLSLGRLSKESVQALGSLWHFVTKLFLRWGVVSPTPNPQDGGPPLVGYLRLLIHYIRS